MKLTTNEDRINKIVTKFAAIKINIALIIEYTIYITTQIATNPTISPFPEELRV